jgi:peptidyl-tRNA hydrolase
MKMYILIKESVPVGLAIVAAAHASLAAYLKFKDSPETSEWLAGPFRKVICRVSDTEFEAAKAIADNVVLTESALGSIETAIAFKPRKEWPDHFRFFRLYK